MVEFERLFRTDNTPRDAFLSRLFGIFNEELVRIWCRDPRSPYSDLGRPTIHRTDPKGYSVLDFCLEDRNSRQIYVAEMKCELQYQNYRYLRLDSPEQLYHHDKQAFIDFLATSLNPSQAVVKVEQRPVKVSGGILVWGRTTDLGKSAVIAKLGFADVLSLETIVNDLLRWENREIRTFIETRSGWCNQLFSGIAGSPSKTERE
jgi:hypothetical protein